MSGSVRHERSRRLNRELVTTYAIVLVLMAYFALRHFYPTLFAFFVSFNKYDLLTGAFSFVGIDNYIDTFTDQRSMRSIANTSIYVVGNVVGDTLLGLFFALLLDRMGKGSVVLRTIYFMPVVVSVVALSQLWIRIYHRDLGLLNWALSLVGIGKVGWLVDTRYALSSIIIMNVWREMGFALVIFLAGLKTIPEHFYDAARVDGASAWVVAVIYITPFYWMIVSAIKPQSEMFKFPPTLIPQTVTFDNFDRVFEVIPLGQAYWNTFYTTLYIVLSQLLFCSVAGYIFEKGRFRFRELCFTLILVTMIIPFQSEMVPLFLLMSDLGLVDTHAAIVLPAMITPFAVFFFRQNVKSIPDDLLDAARIDGSGVLGRYWHVVVPNIKPAIGTITIFAFLGAWNNFLWPLIILNSRKKMLIEQVLSVLTAEFAQEPAARMAAATMAVVPILLVFFFSQRYFVRGVALTGLK